MKEAPEKRIEETVKKAQIQLEVVLDEHFPKIHEEGEAKRLNKRGEALALFAEAMMILKRTLTSHHQATLEGIREEIEEISEHPLYRDELKGVLKARILSIINSYMK